MSDRMFDQLKLPPLAEVRVQISISGGITIDRELQGGVGQLREMADRLTEETIAAATAAVRELPEGRRE